MAITYVGANAASTTTSYVSAAMPAGTQEGDFAVLIVRSWQAAITDGPQGGAAGGWTQRVLNSSRGNESNLYVFTGFCMAKPEVNGAYMYFAADGNHHLNLLVFRGVDPSNPVSAVAQAYSASGTSNITPGLPTVPANSMIVRAVATGLSVAGASCSWPTTVDERTDNRSSAGYSYMSTATSLSGITPGPVGSEMATYSTAGYGIMATIALTPMPDSRLRLGNTAVPLMLGNTEVNLMGP